MINNSNHLVDISFTQYTQETPVSADFTKVTEIAMAEIGFTHENDEKPIVATYRCGPCIAFGGFDPNNKISFVSHLSSADMIKKEGAKIFDAMKSVQKKEIVEPIQIHLRGGWQGASYKIRKNIKKWIKQHQDLPMVIHSDYTLLPQGSVKSLFIDSRTGIVGSYSPEENPNFQPIDQNRMRAMLQRTHTHEIDIFYYPHNQSNL